MVRSYPVRQTCAASASNHAMFASEMMDKPTAVCAGDDEPADLTFANGANVAVISGCTMCLADVERECGPDDLAAYAAAMRPRMNTCWPRVRHHSATTT